MNLASYSHFYHKLKQMQPTAAILIIGNEILSGRTQDKNVNFLATQLTALGIQLSEVRIVRDVENSIIDAINALRTAYDYVLTSGGIGPTHDDITSASIAKAFDVKLIEHPEALRRLSVHYANSELNEARRKMAKVPEGAILIDNPVSSAPGFAIENVHVLAGVPSILQAMFMHVKTLLPGGTPLASLTLTVTGVTEGMIAAELTQIQALHLQTEIGSYPFIKDGKLGVSFVCRAETKSLAEATISDIQRLVEKHTQDYTVEGYSHSK